MNLFGYVQAVRPLCASMPREPPITILMRLVGPGTQLARLCGIIPERCRYSRRGKEASISKRRPLCGRRPLLQLPMISHGSRCMFSFQKILKTYNHDKVRQLMDASGRGRLRRSRLLRTCGIEVGRKRFCEHCNVPLLGRACSPLKIDPPLF